jgi:hypothetical protein
MSKRGSVSALTDQQKKDYNHLVHLARDAESQGKKHQAIELIEKARQIYPYDDRLKKKLDELTVRASRPRDLIANR